MVRFAKEEGMAEALQRAAREEMKLRLLRDIAVDITVCRLEGWDYKDYLCELKSMIEDFIKEDRV